MRAQELVAVPRVVQCGTSVVPRVGAIDVERIALNALTKRCA